MGAGTDTEDLTVLCIDDERVTREFEDGLSRADGSYELLSATTAAGGLERLAARAVDCVVTAYELPDDDGLTVVRTLADRGLSLPVALFPDSGDETVASRAISAGVDEYIPRDAASGGLETLVEWVETLASTGVPVGSRSQRFAAAFPDLVFVLDRDGRYVDLVATGDDDLLFDDPDRLLGRHVQDLLPTETADRILKSIRDALATGRSQRLEYQLDAQAGTRWFEARVTPTSSPEPDPDPETADRSVFPATVYFIARDITERKRREREYEQIFEKVNDGIVVFDPETGTITEVNRSYHDLVGYEDLERIRALGIEGLSASDEGYTGERGKRLIREVAATGSPRTVEWRAERADGEHIWLEATLAPAEIRGNQRVLSIQRDITERKRREREYEQVFNNVNDIIAVRDPETGELLDANDSYAALLGYDKEALLGTSIGDIGVTEEGYDDARGMDHIEAVMRSDASVEFEWKARDADGEIHVMDVRGTAARINGERRYVAIGRDVTDRRRRERAIESLQRATTELQRAETAEAVATTTVEAASDVLGLPAAVCWTHDGSEADERAWLSPIAATDPAREADLVTGLSSERYEYRVFREGDVREYVPSDYGPENPLATGVLLPLGDHGLIAAGTRQEVQAGESLLGLAQALADHVTTALDRVGRARAVRESEQRFRLIAERIDDAIYLARPDFSELLYINPAYEAITGQPVEELYDDPRSFIDAIDPRDREGFEAEFEAMVDEIDAGTADDRYDFEFRIRRPSGDIRWTTATGYVVELSEGRRRYVGILRDTTERKRREQRLEVFNRVLRHNLRNQLDVIRSHAEALMSRPQDGHADRIAAAVDELADLGTQAREADRLMSTTAEPTVVDVAELLRDAVDRHAGSGKTVRTDIGPVTAVGHEQPLRIAAEEAIENAIEHADSRVTVKLCRVATGDGYEIVVEDDGDGLPTHELRPVQRGTETDFSHGSGLGLWRLRWSVEKLGGDLSFETDGGTTVRITVPDPTAGG